MRRPAVERPLERFVWRQESVVVESVVELIQLCNFSTKNEWPLN